MISTIIPSHNEENLLGECIQALIAGVNSRKFELIAVCNGCRDKTSNIVRSYGYKVTLIETDVASKSHALNLGDKTARSFPRFYLDADVILDCDSVVNIAQKMRESNFLTAAPKVKMDHSLFKYGERKRIYECSSIVLSPTNLKRLIKIKTRSRLGRYELMEKFPEGGQTG